MKTICKLACLVMMPAAVLLPGFGPASALAAPDAAAATAPWVAPEGPIWDSGAGFAFDLKAKKLQKTRQSVSGISCHLKPGGQRLCLFVFDEGTQAAYATLGDGLIRPEPGLLQFPGRQTELDAEAAASDGTFVFVTGSHSAKRGDCASNPGSRHVLRLRLDPATGRALPGEVSDSTRLWTLMQTQPLLQAHVGENKCLGSQPPPKAPGLAGQQGVNIEGLAAKGGQLIFGFRGPVIDGVALALAVNARALFEGGDAQPQLTRLALGPQRGIRDMLAVSDGVLLLAGPDDDSADVGWALFHWDGLASARLVQPRLLARLDLRRVKLRACDAELKPEALTLLDVSPQGYRLLLLSDGLCDGGPLLFKLPKKPVSPLAGLDFRVSLSGYISAIMNTPFQQAEQLFAQSSSAIAADEFATAETLLLDALQLAPGLAEAHANLAWLLDRRGSVNDAVRHYELAIELQPGNARIHLNFGALLAELKFFHAAEAAYQRALSIEPTLAGTWCNLGALLAQIDRDDEAEASLRKAVELDPLHAAAHFNLACLLLRKGRFAEGWKHLEFRDWYHPIEERLRCGRWRGQPLRNRAVLMVYEAGFGDVIQFCRYVRLLRAQGAEQVDILCHPELKELLLSLDGVGTVFGFDEDTGTSDWDYWVPMLSLPHHLDTRLETVPAVLPYLHADAAKAEHWRQEITRLAPRPGLRVGLVWHGNPKFSNDEQRSLPGLLALAPLWELPEVHFFSLQKGQGEQELQALSASQPLIDLAPELHNFADTAAAIAALDLVISVDTAVAHLAGALGKPCWVLLPDFLTDWRWLEVRQDSPWYPGVMRLWRQGPDKDWKPVVAQIRAALAGRARPRD